MKVAIKKKRKEWAYGIVCVVGALGQNLPFKTGGIFVSKLHRLKGNTCVGVRLKQRKACRSSLFKGIFGFRGNPCLGDVWS